MSGIFSPPATHLDPAAAAAMAASWVDAIQRLSISETDTGGVLTAALDRGQALLSLTIDHPDRQAAEDYFWLPAMPRPSRALVIDALRVALRHHRPQRFVPPLAA